MITVTKHFSFEACHHLPHYVGACHKLHGHSYKLSVTVTGEIEQEGEKAGMIIDFKDLKKIVKKEVVDVLDHSYLNDIFPNPTAENMVYSIGEALRLKFDKKYKLVSVKLWETADSYAEYIPD